MLNFFLFEAHFLHSSCSFLGFRFSRRHLIISMRASSDRSCFCFLNSFYSSNTKVVSSYDSPRSLVSLKARRYKSIKCFYNDVFYSEMLETKLFDLKSGWLSKIFRSLSFIDRPESSNLGIS